MEKLDDTEMCFTIHLKIYFIKFLIKLVTAHCFLTQIFKVVFFVLD